MVGFSEHLYIYTKSESRVVDCSQKGGDEMTRYRQFRRETVRQHVNDMARCSYEQYRRDNDVSVEDAWEAAEAEQEFLDEYREELHEDWEDN